MTLDVAPVMKCIELPNNVTLPYVEQGDVSGTPVLFLHAVADSWHSFERLLPYLPEFIHAIVPTQRGHGNASHPEAGYRPRDFAADLLALMDMLQLKAAVLVGGSSGGVIARRFAIDHPERILGLVLLGSPFTLKDKPGLQELWGSTISKITDPIDPQIAREFVEGTLAQPVSQAFLKVLVQESLKAPAHVWKATFEGLLKDDSSGELKKIRAPTLIIWGNQDAFLPLSDQKALTEAITGSQFIVYPGAGHAFYWEDPARVASDIVAFVEKISD